MERPESLRIVQIAAPPSRLAIARDVAIILVCAALLVGTIVDVLQAPRAPQAPTPTRSAASVSM